MITVRELDLKLPTRKPLLLVDVEPVYDYKDGARTEIVSGYKYTAAMADKQLKTVTVKIPGAQQMNAPEDGFCEVKFDDLEIYLYVSQGQIQVGARATAIHPIGGNKPS